MTVRTGYDRAKTPTNGTSAATPECNSRAGTMFGANGKSEWLGAGIPLSTVITSIGFCPQNPSDKTGAAMAVAPVSYSFAPVIASSKHLPHGGCPKRRPFSCGKGRFGEKRPVRWPKAARRAKPGVSRLSPSNAWEQFEITSLFSQSHFRACQSAGDDGSGTSVFIFSCRSS